MLTQIIPKLPMRDKARTLAFYTTVLGFRNASAVDYPTYLILEKDDIELHFFEFTTLDPTQNDGQVYIRTSDIDTLYQSVATIENVIHPNGHLMLRPWGQKEFAMLDPDNNLLTFGQAVTN